MGMIAPLYIILYIIHFMTNNVIKSKNTIINENLELRRVQAYAGEKSLLLVLPKIFAEKLKISKGDYLIVKLNDQTLIVEKAVISKQEESS
jgi:hypothetical protein